MINRGVVKVVTNKTMRIGVAPMTALNYGMDAKRKGLINEQNIIAGG